LTMVSQGVHSVSFWGPSWAVSSSWGGPRWGEARTPPVGEDDRKWKVAAAAARMRWLVGGRSIFLFLYCDVSNECVCVLCVVRL